MSSCSPPPPSLAPPRPRHLPPHPPQHVLPQPSSAAPLLTSSSHSFGGPSPCDVVSWTSSISRCARSGCLADAADRFSDMLSSAIPPNHVTILALLSACADFSSSPFSLPLGLALHALTLKLSIFSDRRALLLLTTALLNFYSNSGRPALARQLFDRMPQRSSVTYNSMIAGLMKNAEIDEALNLFRSMPSRDLVSWTSLIDGCVKNGLPEDALEIFRRMQVERIDSDYVTVIGVAAACGDLGALGHGIWLHRFALSRGLHANVRVGNSLIDMYSRCGRVDFARQVFDEMPSRTLVTWNSMIVGFAANGCSEEALIHFSALQRSEIRPDGVSFTGALTACSHAGMVCEGLRLYKLMQREYRIPARVEHYGCVVDLLGRAGLLEEAMRLVEEMPVKPNEVVLGSLMAACREHGDVGMAERLMDFLLEVRPETDSNYVLLSNIYAAMGRWEGVGKVRSLMKDLGVKKKPGCSAVEVGCSVHEFVAGDGGHPQTEEIYSLLGLLHLDMELHGYEPVEAIGQSE